MINWPTFLGDKETRFVQKELDLLRSDLEKEIRTHDAPIVALEIVGRFKVFVETRATEWKKPKAREELGNTVGKVLSAFYRKHRQGSSETYIDLSNKLTNLLKGINSSYENAS